MKKAAAVIVTSILLSACASGPPPLTEQEQTVRSVTDASECEYITSDTAMRIGSRLSLSDSLKRTTHKNGGDSYKILHTTDGYSDLFGKTTEAKIEIRAIRHPQTTS